MNNCEWTQIADEHIGDQVFLASFVKAIIYGLSCIEVYYNCRHTIEGVLKFLRELRLLNEMF